MDGDEVIVRITATPEQPSEGHQLADEVIAAVASVTDRDPSRTTTIEHAQVPGNGTGGSYGDG